MLKKILSAAVVGAGIMVMSTFGASAAIVCQGHVCWHVHDVYDFPHEAGLIVHEDGLAGLDRQPEQGAAVLAMAEQRGEEAGLADAALANASRGDLDRALECAEKILAVDPAWAQAAIFAPYPPWIVACVLHWKGDPRAETALSWAAELRKSMAASIDAPELREHFSHLPFNMAIQEAVEHGRWPSLPKHEKRSGRSATGLPRF